MDRGVASWRFGTCFLVILELTTACRKISWDAMMPYAQSLCVAKLTEMGRDREVGWGLRVWG